jgi:hypothetical protein
MAGVQERIAMKVGEDPDVHLCYCTNIHPGESWSDVRTNLENYVVKVKNNVAPAAPFGIGLRLSGLAAEQLAEPGALEEFRDFLNASNMYVFTINGFPYGEFHGTPVKENVYRPDWLEDERVTYSNRLAALLAELLPADESAEGSISTVPGAYKPRMRGLAAEQEIADALVRHAAVLVDIERKSGKRIGIALEPEPCCFLETVEETLDFFESRILGRESLDRFAALTGTEVARAEETLRDKIGICFDACHGAVEFENPQLAFDRIEGAGIRILKLQLSAGLRIASMTDVSAQRLRRFVDDVYLHQVVARRGDSLVRTPDLPEALDRFAAESSESSGSPEEWRVHFHVPLFLERLDGFENTQQFLRETLALQKTRTMTGHLEVETYTWDVLPEEHRSGDVVASVSRELKWVLRELGA